MAVKKTLLDRLIREAQDTVPEQSLLFDPRFDSRVLEQERLRNLATTVEERGTQNAPGIPLADLEGQPFITSMSDRTRAGGLLTHINQIPLRDAVNLQGGQGFMFENPGAVWANAAGGVRQHQEAAQALKQATGQDPLFIPWRMAPSGQDFATMSGEAMISYAAANLGKKAKRSFDASMKNIIPSWPGIDSPDSLAAFRNSKNVARQKAQTMMDRDFRNIGGLGRGEARLAVGDPSQYVARDGGIQNIGRINLDAPMIKSTGHPSYPAGLPGEGLGRTSQDVGVFELMPDEVRARGIVDPLNPPQNHLRSLHMKPYGGVITEEVLRNLQARGVDVTKPALVMGALGLGALGTEEAEAGLVGTVADLINRGFPEGTAQRIASGELPMDQASRMARAAEQGFDTSRRLVHTTYQDVPAFDFSRLGENTIPNASDEKLAETARLGAFFADKSLGEEVAGRVSVPVYVPPPEEKFYSLDNLADFVFHEGGGPNARETLLRRGSRVVDFDDEEFGGVSTVALDPTNIRSVNAAFDPANRNSANLLASIGGAGLLGALGTEEAQAGPVNSALKMVADLPGRNELNWWPISGDEAIEGGWNKTGDELVILDKIFLDTQNRGRGEGRKIINQLIKDAAAEYPGREMGLLAEPLDEYTDADQLVKFYESLGFDVGDYADGMSGIPMTMRLPALKAPEANKGKANLLGRATPGAMAATAATGGGLMGLMGTGEAEAGPVGTVADLINRGFPEGTAQRIASGELPMDQASRMARAAEQGYTMPVYHGTGADITEFDKAMSGLGTHVGSPEQATNRLLDIASQRGGGYRSRATQGYDEGANIMPLLMRAGNAYRLKDLGEWNNAEVVSVGLKNTNIPHDRNMQYEASEEAATYEDGADWVASPENAQMLDELRKDIQNAGYDTIKYRNEVENSGYNTSGLRPDAQRQYDDLLSRYHDTLKQSAALRSRLDSEAIAGLPAEEQVRAITEGVQRPRAPEEDQLQAALELLSDQRDKVVETGAYSPTSYIALDDAQLRSVNAAFDPANRNSANLLASMGGAGLLGAAAFAPGEAQATPQPAPAVAPQSTRPSLMDMVTLPTDLLTRFGEVTARDIGGLFAGAAQGPEAYERIGGERSIPISPLAERVAAGTDQAIGAGLGALLDYQPLIGPSGTDLLGMAAEGYQRIPEQYREPLLRTGMGLLGVASVFPGARAVGRAVSDRIPKRKKRSTAQ